MDRSIGAVVMVVALGCGDTAITPDPTGTGGSTSNGTGGHSTGGSDQGGGGSNSTGGSAPGGGYESGERLKAKTLVGEDGSRSPVGWFDSQLGVDCSWRAAADGQQRCLPSNAVLAPYFGDPGCTIPVGVSTGGCGLPTHLLVSTDSCNSSFRVHAVTGTYAGTTFVKSGVDCLSLGPQPNAFIGGAELPASSFVAATVEIEP